MKQNQRGQISLDFLISVLALIVITSGFWIITENSSQTTQKFNTKIELGKNLEETIQLINSAQMLAGTEYTLKIPLKKVAAVSDETGLAKVFPLVSIDSNILKFEIGNESTIVSVEKEFFTQPDTSITYDETQNILVITNVQ